METKADGSTRYRFTEAGRDRQWIRLYDAGRGMSLRLPIDGGTCAWSTDDGKNWNSLYHIDKAP